MAIELKAEKLVPLHEAPGSVPGPPHRSTVSRWAHQGVGGIRLETVVVGGRRYTSEEALARFIARTTARANG